MPDTTGDAINRVSTAILNCSRRFMKILVTGAAGRIGRQVVVDLLGRGHEVRALDHVALPADLTKKQLKLMLGAGCIQYVCDYRMS